MNENVQELVKAMLAKDASGTEAAFQAAMAEKISAKLDDMRSNIAQSMFKSPVEEPSSDPVVEEELTLENIDTLTEEQLDEVLTKSTPASEYISDFVKSDNPKFEGKSKKERIRMALGAYYAKNPEKSNK